jgi:hypothetical protein
MSDFGVGFALATMRQKAGASNAAVPSGGVNRPAADRGGRDDGQARRGHRGQRGARRIIGRERPAAAGKGGEQERGTERCSACRHRPPLGSPRDQRSAIRKPTLK